MGGSITRLPPSPNGSMMRVRATSMVRIRFVRAVAFGKRRRALSMELVNYGVTTHALYQPSDHRKRDQRGNDRGERETSPEQQLL